MYWLFLSVSLYAVNNVLWKIFVKNEHPLRLISRRAIFTVAIAFTAIWFTKADVISFVQNPKAIYVLAGSLFGVAGLVMMAIVLKAVGLPLEGNDGYIFKNRKPGTHGILFAAGNFYCRNLHVYFQGNTFFV